MRARALIATLVLWGLVSTAPGHAQDQPDAARVAELDRQRLALASSTEPVTVQRRQVLDLAQGYEEAGDIEKAGRSYAWLGSLDIRLGDMAGAVSSYNSALRLCGQVGHRQRIATSTIDSAPPGRR